MHLVEPISMVNSLKWSNILPTNNSQTVCRRTHSQGIKFVVFQIPWFHSSWHRGRPSPVRNIITFGDPFLTKEHTCVEKWLFIIICYA